MNHADKACTWQMNFWSEGMGHHGGATSCHGNFDVRGEWISVFFYSTLNVNCTL